MLRRSTLLAIAIPFAMSCHAADVQRIETGNRISENVPASDAALAARLQRYANLRSASFGGWNESGDGVFITTRFGNTMQAHWVKKPGGARDQLTFFDEPVVSLVPNPTRKGFAFGKDVGGSEFWQLYWFDLATRQTRLLTDGKSRNDSPLWSRDGKYLAFSSTTRNGTDTDIWVLDLDSGEKKPVVTVGGAWSATDFSPDGKQLLVQRSVSINEVHPGVVDLASGKLTLFPVAGRPADGGRAAFGAFRFSQTASARITPPTKAASSSRCARTTSRPTSSQRSARRFRGTSRASTFPPTARASHMQATKTVSASCMSSTQRRLPRSLCPSYRAA